MKEDANTTDPTILFQRWYCKPLRRLKEIPNGDGGFIALATCCFLYERYAVAEGINVDDEKQRNAKMIKDFGITENEAGMFWDIIRNGLLHSGMPKVKDHGKEIARWRFKGDFTKTIEVDTNGEIPLLKVQLWKFMDIVIDLWENNIDLLITNDSFPWARISFDEDYKIPLSKAPGTGSCKNIK